jgi:hypothetical protein
VLRGWAGAGVEFRNCHTRMAVEVGAAPAGPCTEDDFSRDVEDEDPAFYAFPRYMRFLDDAATYALKLYLQEVFFASIE